MPPFQQKKARLRRAFFMQVSPPRMPLRRSLKNPHIKVGGRLHTSERPVEQACPIHAIRSP